MMITKPYVGQISNADKMTAEQRTSFFGPYQTVALPAGAELWRFISKQMDHRFSAFWVDAQTMTTIMQTLHTTGRFSQEDKRENVMNSLAILQDWSQLNWRLKIRLKKEVIAYTGQTDTQKKFTDVPNTTPFGGPVTIRNVTETRIGREVQYVIPRFKGLPNVNEWASVELFVHI